MALPRQLPGALGDSIGQGEAFRLLQAAGFDDETAAIMVAVGVAESGLRKSAKGDRHLTDSKWGPSVGPWQIRSLKAHKGTGKYRDETRLTDPAFNAQSAKQVYDEQGLNAWTDYRNGKYKQHLKSVEELSSTSDPILNPLGNAVGNATDSTLGMVKSLIDAILNPELWRRVGLVGAGLIIFIIGALFLMRDLIPAGKIASAAKGLAK